MPNVKKLLYYYIVENETETGLVERAAFLAGSLSIWRESMELLGSPIVLLLSHEAKEAFQQETEAESGEVSATDLACAKRYVDALVSLKVPNDIDLQLLEKMHRRIFDHPDGYQFFPGELRADGMHDEFHQMFSTTIGFTDTDSFSKIYSIYKSFVKLSPFRAGNHVMANALLHILFIHFRLTPSPMLPLAKFVTTESTASLEEFLKSILHAEECTNSIFQATRVIEARYRDSVATLEARPKKVAHELLSFFMERENFTVRDIEAAYGKKSKITYHTLNKLMTRLVEDFHVLEILNGGERNRVFTLKGYTKLFAYYE